MKKFLLVAMLIVPVVCYAEPFSVSWDAVTQYADNTSIPLGTTVSYNVYWSPDNTLSTVTQLGTTTTSTSQTFDVAITGRNRGTTIYLTARTVVDNVQSDFAAPLAWVIPFKKPGRPRINQVAPFGP